MDITKKAPELNTGPVKIDKIINRINSGDIKIPAFQRSYVWKQNQIIELLDSIYNNYPIGSVLLWNSNERLNHTRNIVGISIPETTEEYPVNYVLDGQQRMSSIYAVFNDKKIQDKSSENYNPDLSLFDISYDFISKSFKPTDEISENIHAVSMNNLIDVTKLIDIFSELDPLHHSDAKELMSRFLNYEIPVVTIKNRSKGEVGNIFERINNTGTKLGTLDLMTAWTWTNEFHLQEKMVELFATLDEKGFGKLNRNIILQSISAIIQDDTTTNAIVSLDGSVIRENWSILTESLKKAIDFLSTELKCKTLDFLPAQQQIVAITKFFSISGMPTVEQYETLKKWFWRVSFSNRYSTGRTTDKMNIDVYFVSEVRNNDFTLLDIYRTNVTVTDLINTKFSIGNLVTRSVLLLLAQYHPRDLVTNNSIDLSKALSKYNRKEFHHVFPNAYLKSIGFDYSSIFSTMNFCYLPSGSNKKISSTKPSEYFFNIIPSAHYNNILRSNLLPVEEQVYKKNLYEEFLGKRAKIIIEELDNFI